MSAMVDDDTVDTVIELKCSGAVFFVLKVQFLDVQRQQSFSEPEFFYLQPALLISPTVFSIRHYSAVAVI